MRDVTEVAAGVYIATAARDLTNTTILVQDGYAFLIDPSWEPADLDGLVEWLSAAGLQVVGGFATHAHYDHVLWHPGFGDVPRWASVVTAERASRLRDDLVSGLGPGWPTALTELVGRLTGTTELTLRWPSPVELVRHDAHSPGHTALWLPVDTGVAEYLAGLETLRPYAERAAVVIPGHGHPGPDAALRYRTDLAWLSTSGTDLDDGLDLDR